MKKSRIILFTILLSAIAFISGCSKKCGDCPEGYYLAVDEPKDDNCICCPSGSVYNTTSGQCE